MTAWPTAELQAIKRARADLDEQEAAVVTRLRALGWSWSMIGDALGVTRQAVHARFS